MKLIVFIELKASAINNSVHVYKIYVNIYSHIKSSDKNIIFQ